MSVADLHDLELIWPSLGPTDVIATGTFDQWSSSIHLVKGDAGFVGTVKVPWGQKIAYKFIVDGNWRCRNDRPQEDDGNGNMNNVHHAPEKPEPIALPARLSIPGVVPSEGYGDIDNMVTAVEFHPSAAPAAIRGSLPPPIPQITVEGLQLPSPVNESKLNTAAATEGNISPTSVTGAEANQAPASYHASILPLNDNGFVPLPPINGNGETFGGFPTHAPVQFTKEDAPTSPLVPENAVVIVTPESAVQGTTGASTRTVCGEMESATKKPEAIRVETAVSVPDGRVSTSSAPTSSTLTQKKRRSLFARIKHIFDKDKDKQEKKEKNKH